MFKHYRQQLARILGIKSDRPARRRRPARSALIVESLESRDLPAPLTWAAGVSLPIADGGIVAQPSGTVLLALAGPSTTSYNVSATDPTWQATITSTHQPLDFARTSPGVGALPNGYFVVFGGTQNGFAISSVTQYDPNTVTVPDGVTNHTKSLKSMNTPRALLGWATDTNHLSYAIGGQDNNGTPLATVEAYNPTANSWSFVASLPQTLYSESAVSDGAGHIFTFGGVGADGTITSNVYRYTISTNTWDQVSGLQVAVRDSAAVLASNGLIYVLGGTTSTGTTATVESYNITTNTWTLQTSLPQAVSSEAAAVDSLGRIEVLGGYDANGNAVASISISQKLNQADLAPTITSAAIKTAVVNTAYSYQVRSTGNPQATYTLTTAPNGMTINASTGLISWTPTYATEGIDSVTVAASNSAGTTSQTFSVSVSPVTPTGLTGAGASTTTSILSWDASPDPNVTRYDIYRRTGLPHGGYINGLFASNVPTSTFTLTGTYATGTYLVSAVNSAGLVSALSGTVTVNPFTAPFLYVATTPGGGAITSLTLNVGQTGQVYLKGGYPAPTFSVVSGPSGVTVDSTTGVATYTPSVADIGTQPTVFAATNAVGTANYTFYYVVQALKPTVTVSSGPVTYDGNSHAATATAIGTDGVTPVAGSFAFTYGGSATPPTATGTYAVVATFTSADPSYANATVSSSLTINKATPTITVNSGPFDYDGNPHGATGTAVGVDGATPVNGSFQITYNGASTAPTGPGLFTVSAAFASSDSNYASATVTGNLIINSPGASAPTLNLVDGSATYDGNAHPDTASAVGTDGVTPVAGAFITTYNGSTTAPTQAGSYAVVANFISSDLNYTNATITSTLTISQATPTITITGSPFYYDTFGQAAHVSAVGVDGVTLVNGTLSVLYNGSSTLPVNAGTYNVSVTFTSNDANYLPTTATGSMTIQQAGPSLYFSLNGGLGYYIYNGTPQGVTGSALGYFNVPINGTFTYAYYDSTGMQLPGTPTAAGYYSFTESFNSLDPNYSSGTLGYTYSYSIFVAAPTATVSGGPFTYNGQAQSATATAVGLDGVTPVPGTATFTYNGSSSTPVLAGTYAVVASFSSTNPNYGGATATGTLVINKATPTFSNLASPTVNAGTASVTLSGHIAAGSAAPGGDDVAITLNGVTQAVSVSSGGSFSTSFNIQGLATGTYAITYVYLGDATRFNAASTGSGTLTIRPSPVVTVNPTSQTVNAGQTVTFTAAATGNPAPTVRWQVSTNGGTSYTNISGATSTTLTLTNVTASQNGYEYRAVFTNSLGSATTTVATLTVQFAPIVTTNPVNRSVTAGQSVTFTAAATGNPTPTVQWQVSFDGGLTFSDVTGATSTTLTLTGVTAGQNGYEYRAVFTNSIDSATTIAAILTVL